MDYNDIAAKLKKTLHSLNARFDDDIAVYTTVERGPNGRLISHDFSIKDKDEVINKIFIILYNISSLKDHLKNCLEKQAPKKGKLVEIEIDKSIHLQVLIDIVNQEKHGYPLKKINRSGKNPLIEGVDKVLTLSASDEGRSTIMMNTDGSFTTEGDVHTQIVAFIRDGNHLPLFGLDEMVDTSYSIFESFAKQYNCC